MLDKTVEFHSIIMRHPNDKLPMCPNIPEGFSIREDKYKQFIELAE